MTDETTSAALGAVTARRLEARAVQQLLGIVQGVLADGHLHDTEIQLLSTWVSANAHACGGWPGSAVAAMLRQALADGRIDEQERQLLSANLQALIGESFGETGSVSAAPTQLPVDDSVHIVFDGAVVVHTGTFLYGTRAACERATAAMGGVPASSVSRKVGVVVVGGMVGPSWLTESFGRKIMDAVTLRDSGHPVAIISEEHWIRCMGSAGVRDAG